MLAELWDWKEAESADLWVMVERSTVLPWPRNRARLWRTEPAQLLSHPLPQHHGHQMFKCTLSVHHIVKTENR